MNRSQAFTIFSAAMILMATVSDVRAQPLLREGDAGAEQQAEPTPDELERRESARRKAEFEEQQRMKQQEELMRLQGERMLAEREEIERNQRMMRYALIIAVVVIGATVLVSFARSRAAGGDERPGSHRS
ncbi:MAG: hypothetical protein ACREHD_01500 [Pirellulales bacterium]